MLELKIIWHVLLRNVVTQGYITIAIFQSPSGIHQQPVALLLNSTTTFSFRKFRKPEDNVSFSDYLNYLIFN